VDVDQAESVNVRFYGIRNGIKEVLNLVRLLTDGIERTWIVGGIILCGSSVLVAQVVARSSPYLSHCS
jgi:hypothetical protein